MPDASVRPARPEDAPVIAQVQARVWRRAYAGVLPEAVVDAVGGDSGALTWEATIREAPSARHRVLVAADETGAVVGFAALAPSGDPDLDPETDAELHALCVDPGHEGAGHGSRLVNACADVLRGLGTARLQIWLGDPDARLRAFLESAGWADDGATRSLDLRGDGEVLVAQRRLATELGSP